MAFPQVADSDTTNGAETANTTSTTCTYPANCASGDLLVGFFSKDGTSTSLTWPAGWSQLFAGASAANALAVWTKIATGSESGTFSVTHNNEQTVWRIVRITAASWFGTGGVEANAGQQGTNTDVISGSLNPAGWDAEDTLWFHVGGNDNGNRTMTNTVAPGTWTNFFNDNTVGNTGCGMATARSENNTATLSVTTGFTLDTADDWVAVAVAIRPAAATTSIFVSWIGNP